MRRSFTGLMIADRWRNCTAFVFKGQEVHDPRAWTHYVLRNIRNRQPHNICRIPEDLNRLKRYCSYILSYKISQCI